MSSSVPKIKGCSMESVQVALAGRNDLLNRSQPWTRRNARLSDIFILTGHGCVPDSSFRQEVGKLFTTQKFGNILER